MSTPAQVVLVGPPGSGKSTLMDCLRTCSPRGVLVDPIDLAEERDALARANGVLFVVGAPDGIDASTAYLWREVAAAGLPRAIVVTKLDEPRADFDETCALIGRVFDPHACVPFTLPVMDDDDAVVAFLDLSTGTITQYAESAVQHHDADVEHLDLTETTRARLADSLAARDLTLADRWQAVSAAHITPIVGFSGLRCVGREEVAQLVECLASTTPQRDVDWPTPLPRTDVPVSLRITIPSDYVVDVIPTLRRVPGVDLTSDDPGDGTHVLMVRGASSDLHRIPIDVHGMTDGTSHCVAST